MSPRVVIVTGASKGFGMAASQELARRGHTVVATMRSPDRDGPAVREGFEDLIHVAQLDVTDGEQTTAVVDDTLERFGRIDAIVNNAGYGLYGTVEDVGVDEVMRLIDTNLLGQLRLCQAVIGPMREAGRGTIVNVASAGVYIVAPLTGLYSASKMAVAAMTEALRLEVKQFGIHVVSVEPGMYRSDWQYGSLDVCRRLENEESAYQEASMRALEAFREMGETRPGTATTGATIADMVELEQEPPLHVPVGDDAYRLREQRRMLTDEAWEQMMLQGPFFHEGSSEGFAGYSA
ncbi:MAG: SDR family oxidoreductase [Acidimicrobiales bacterium]|nr:SDR family oxidoreductase [Acidimicrobiales bacterium]